MNLSDYMSQEDIIVALAERVSKRHPNPTGKCETMSRELVNELKKRGIFAKHAVGMFKLDEPDALRYVEYDDEEGRDEYEVEHDWVEVEGKILDISAKQFKRSVHEPIPDILFMDYNHRLYERYQLVNYHA